MKIKKGLTEYTLEEHIDRLLGAILDDFERLNRISSRIIVVNIEDYNKFDKKETGPPRYICPLLPSILIHPIPDNNYIVRIQGMRIIEQ